MNLLGAYLGDFASFDYLFGNDVPLSALQSFGGSHQGSPQVARVGLGGAMRGIDSGRYDTNLKFVDNLELRLDGPALLRPDTYPILVAFADSGFFDQVGEGEGPEAFGWRYSLGAELRLCVLGLFSPGIGFVHSKNDTMNGRRDNVYASFLLKF